MKKQVITITLFLVSFYITAQPPSIEWQKALGGGGPDEASSIQQTTDGGYIVAGRSNSFTSSNYSSSVFWLIKLTSTGVISWEKVLGGNGYDLATSIQQTTDGGYIVAGYSNSFDGDVTGNHGNYDYWIVKLTSSGAITWQKSFGGTGDDKAWSIQQTTDGGYIVAGETDSKNGDVTGNTSPENGCWVVKMSNMGVITWQIFFTKGLSYSSGAKSIQQTSDGGFIVAGHAIGMNGPYWSPSVMIGPSYWVIKLNSSGVIQWEKILGGSSSDYSTSIQQTVDGGYIVAGYSESNDGDVIGNHGGYDYWVVKLTSTGTIVWQKSLGGTGDDGAYSIQQTTDGGFIVAGSNNSIDGDVTVNLGGNDYWVVKLTSTGNIEWQKSLGGTEADAAWSIKQTTDGDYIVAGGTLSSDGDVTGHTYNSDYWVVKLSSSIGVSEIAELNKIIAYPNPAKDLINITNGQGNYIITDVFGRMVKEGYITSEDFQLNTNELKSGIYFLISKENNSSIKFIKK
ncbi:MAG: hypothetical protein KFKLKKLM_00856 [Flavobacteriales bacterium]|nr:hypothetical protein [Flavobacteriales bacterium]